MVALADVSSKLAVWWPYAHTIRNYLKGTKGAHFAHGEFHAIAAGSLRYPFNRESR